MKMLDAFAERKSYKLVMKNASLDQGADHKTFAAARRWRRQLGQNLATTWLMNCLFVASPRRLILFPAGWWKCTTLARGAKWAYRKYFTFYGNADG